MKPRIHLIAPAGTCKPFLAAVSDRSVSAFVALVQKTVGPAYDVSCNAKLIAIDEDEDHGGRRDDAERASDIQTALGGDDVRCVLALRGGAWLTRILPRIDFSVLDKRTTRVVVIGFSELSTLVNIVGAHEKGVGVYDMSPAFLTYGLKRFALLRARAQRAKDFPNQSDADGDEPPPLYEGLAPEEWMKQRLTAELIYFLEDVVSIIEGRGTRRPIRARIVAGALPDKSEARFIGGNLCVFTTLLGTPYQSMIRPDDHWLVLEDINEKPERIDRFLARLTLAGYFERSAGVLLGDFHNGERTHTDAVVELLRYHLPATRQLPVLVTQDVGHVWPMSPIPLHVPTSIELMEDDWYAVRWEAEATCAAGSPDEDAEGHKV